MYYYYKIYNFVSSVFFLLSVLLLILNVKEINGFVYKVTSENKDRGSSWKYLTRFCFNEPPVNSVNVDYKKPEIKIIVKMKYYPGILILINWEDARAQAACARVECKQDVTWANYVKDSVTCNERKEITGIAGDRIDLPDLMYVYNYGDFDPRSNANNEVAFTYGFWNVQCHDPFSDNVKEWMDRKQSPNNVAELMKKQLQLQLEQNNNYNSTKYVEKKCIDNRAVYNTTIEFVGDTERWYYFSIGSCNEISDYPLLIDSLELSITNHGNSNNERMLSSNNYYLPSMLLTLGCIAILYTIVGSVFLHVYISIGKLHYLYLIIMVIIYIQDLATLSFLTISNPETHYDGINLADGNNYILILYRIFQSIAQSFLFLQILLIVAGWLIVKNKLKAKVRVIIAAMYGLYLILAIFNVVTDYSFYNPALHTQPYSNIFGISIAVYRSLVSIGIGIQGVYHARIYRYRQRLYGFITTVSIAWLNVISIMKFILISDWSPISVCSEQGFLDIGEHILDHLLLLMLMGLWVPNGYNLKRLRRFESVPKVHQRLTASYECCGCSTESDSEKRKKLIVVKIKDKKLFLQRTFSVLDKFEEGLKSVIENNNELNDMWGYDSNGDDNMMDGDEDDLDFDTNTEVGEDGWVEHKGE